MDAKLRAALAEERKAGFEAIKKLRARLVEVEEERDELKDALAKILGWREYRNTSDVPIERIENIAREALANLEEGK